MFKDLHLFQAKTASLFKQFTRTILFFAAATSILITAGCANVDPHMVQTQTRGKTIAVASALGPNLELNWVGTTIFNNEKGTIAVPDWNMDNLAVNSMSSGLQATQRYAAVNTLSNISRVGEAIPVLPPGSQADYLLLIERWDSGDPMFGTNQSFHGVGIAQRSFMGLVQTKAHIGVCVTLFDLSIGKSIGVITSFEHWNIPTRLKSGGNSNLLANQFPVPIIDDLDLDELQQPITTKLEQMIVNILGDMGLR
ncbi:MAG: hypothetical protein WBM99_05895 [Psychromonas sp.]